MPLSFFFIQNEGVFTVFEILYPREQSFFDYFEAFFNCFLQIFPKKCPK